jgi:hypothetical protein
MPQLSASPAATLLSSCISLSPFALQLLRRSLAATAVLSIFHPVLFGTPAGQTSDAGI